MIFRPECGRVILAVVPDNFLQTNHLRQTNRRQARDARYVYNRLR